jgi:penicillin-binding protein 2
MFDPKLNEDSKQSPLADRLVPVILVIGAMFGILIGRLFFMQMIDESSAKVKQDTTSYTKTIAVPATRGNIYDCKGVLLAYNDLQYNLEMYDSASLSTNAEKNDAIFSLIKLLRDFGYEREFDFYIKIDEAGNLAFTVSGNALLRFKKNAYGLTSIDKLTEQQKSATAEDVFKFLRYGNSSSRMFQISDKYNLEDALEIMAYRYQLFILYPSYSSFRIVSDISDRARISFYENTTKIPGLEISKTTKRVYNNAEYFAHIIGYIGLVNAEELATLRETDDHYNDQSIVGKLGIEKSYESDLAGTDGVATIIVNDYGQVVSKSVTQEPIAGNDLYLTLDSELQIGCYNILKRNIATILLKYIVPDMDYGTKGEDATDIKIPIYEVYYALINNHVIDTKHFTAEDATDLEKSVYHQYENMEESIWNRLLDLLDADCTVTNKQAGDLMSEYLTFLYSKLGSSNWDIVNSSAINTSDEQYQNYVDGKLSLSKFLQYAITQGWIKLDRLNIDSEYYDTNELYGFLHDYIVSHLRDDSEYQSKVYRSLVFNYTLTGRDLSLLLYDQGVLKEDLDTYRSLKNGTLSAYNFITRKIKLLEITPAMLALEPCSGSIVMTDPNTGLVKCLVSYPSYDNNYLTNSIDMDYYNKLLADKSYPMVCRATTSKTTTGSTFKPLMAIAGLTEGVISVGETIHDDTIFKKIEPSPRCWINPGSHGNITVTDAIRDSCNYFFYEVGYRLSLNDREEYVDSYGIRTIQRYAKLFGLGDRSGVEMSESAPIISNTDAIRTSIGYYHSFSPVQICRYLTTVVNEGTCYDLTLINRVETQSGDLVRKNTATVHDTISVVSQSSWDAVKLGMYRVVNAEKSNLRKIFTGLNVSVAGKTGTAQVSYNHPNNALFISFAPYSSPEVCLTVVIPNGYASSNSASVAREVYGFYFEGENKDALLSGNVIAGSIIDVGYTD